MWAYSGETAKQRGARYGSVAPFNGSFRSYLLPNDLKLVVSLLGLYAVTRMEPLRYIRISRLPLLWHPLSSCFPHVKPLNWSHLLLLDPQLILAPCGTYTVI